MNKRLFAALACLGLLLGCAGCQLADPEAAETPEPDRLIGAYVTREYVDLFDIEGYLADNLDSLSDDVLISGEDASAYEGRLWAQPVPQENGRPDDWVFPVEGMGLYCPTTVSDVESSVSTHMDQGVVSNGVHYYATDEGDRVELEFSLYYAGGAEVSFFCNPVYQTPDGRVYLTSGSGVSLDGSEMEPGNMWSVTFSDTASETEDSQTTQTAGDRVVCHIGIMFPPERVDLIQLDGDSRELRRDGYDAGAMPESVTADPACASVLVQTHERAPDGTASVSRELVELTGENDAVTVFSVGEDGLCVPRDIPVVSGEARP